MCPDIQERHRLVQRHTPKSVIVDEYRLLSNRHKDTPRIRGKELLFQFAFNEEFPCPFKDAGIRTNQLFFPSPLFIHFENTCKEIRRDSEHIQKCAISGEMI